MREETRFSPPISRLRAWAMLANLAQYESWHPEYRFGGGVVGLGKKVEFTARFFGRSTQVDALIVAHERSGSIRWKLGTFPFFTMEEGYKLTEDASGLHVRHSVECKGLFGAPAAAFVRAGIRRRMQLQDTSFLVAVRRLSRAGPAGNRHKRRTTAATKGRSVNDD